MIFSHADLADCADYFKPRIARIDTDDLSHADYADLADFLQLTITFLADYCISHRFHRFTQIF